MHSSSQDTLRIGYTPPPRWVSAQSLDKLSTRLILHSFYTFQVAAALLVSDLTLTLWTLGQTLDPPTCTQASFKGCPQLAYSLFLLTHITCDDHSVWVKRAMVAKRKTKSYYSSHSFAIKMSFTTYVLLHDGIHGSVVRIFVGLSWELYCQRKSMRVLKQWQLMGRYKHSPRWVSASKFMFWSARRSVHEGIVRIFVGHY